MSVYIAYTVVLILPVVLAMASIPLRVKQQSAVDIQNPRQQAKLLTGAGERIVHAQSNAWEGLMLFTGALWLAHVNSVSLEALVTPAYIYLAARILHAIFYVSGLAVPRFLSFLAAFSSVLYIVYLALFAS